MTQNKRKSSSKDMLQELLCKVEEGGLQLLDSDLDQCLSASGITIDDFLIRIHTNLLAGSKALSLTPKSITELERAISDCLEAVEKKKQLAIAQSFYRLGSIHASTSKSAKGALKTAAIKAQKAQGFKDYVNERSSVIWNEDQHEEITVECMANILFCELHHLYKFLQKNLEDVPPNFMVWANSSSKTGSTGREYAKSTIKDWLRRQDNVPPHARRRPMNISGVERNKKRVSRAKKHPFPFTVSKSGSITLPQLYIFSSYFS